MSCANTITFDPAPDVPIPPVHFMLESGEGWATGDKVITKKRQAGIDYVGFVFHAHVFTHIDSLAHIMWEGKLYNGRPAHLISTNLGATVESGELTKDGIVTRGVLVDAPMIRGVEWLERGGGEGVMPEDILAAEERCGFKIEKGDVLLVRTGQLHRRNVEGPVNLDEAGSLGCHAACLPLFHERSIAMLGSDTTNDTRPNTYPSLASPVHQVGIVAMGLWLIDSVNLEELAQACKERNRWEFMISMGPLRIHNSTGAPVNPVAIF